MKQLFVIRHAKSSWKHEGLTDHERPLNARGERDAPRMGERLRDADLLPDRILSSDAVRARQTALIVRESAGCTAPLLLLRELYLAAPETYLAHLSRLDATVRRAMVVGHNPGLEELTRLITGQDEALPTAALVHVRLDASTWSDLALAAPRGDLLELWRPKEIFAGENG